MGVDFTIWQVGVPEGDECKALDIEKTADWDRFDLAFNTDKSTFAQLNGDTSRFDWTVGAEKFCLQKTKTVTTADNGQISQDLDLGFYFVAETSYENATIWELNENDKLVQVPGAIVEPAEPFFVSVPYPSFAGDPNKAHTWTYGVHVYPKNQTSKSPTKTIDEKTVNDELVIGSEVEWTIEVPIPDTKADLTQASIYDKLDERLSYSKTVSVTIVDSDNKETVLAGPLKEDEGYTVDLTAKPTIQWDLNASLATLNQYRGETILLTFSTEVTSVGVTAGDVVGGEIANAPGDLGKGYGSKFNGEQTPGENTPYTYWGNLKIQKIDDSASAKPLQGAEFQVFNNYDEKAPENKKCAANPPTDVDPIAKGTSNNEGVVEWTKGTSNNEGDVVWEGVTPDKKVLGLWIANGEKGPLDSPSKHYCVYETVAPAGYTAGSVETVEITPNGGAALPLEVKNVQKEGPKLPVTGSAGILVLSILGGGLVLTGVALAARSRRGNVTA